MVPLQLGNSLEGLHNIKTLIVGGAALSNELKSNLQNQTTAVYETFGMTETITHIAVKRVNGTEKSNAFKVLPKVAITVDERGCLIIDASIFLKRR